MLEINTEIDEIMIISNDKHINDLFLSSINPTSAPLLEYELEEYQSDIYLITLKNRENSMIDPERLGFQMGLSMNIPVDYNQGVICHIASSSNSIICSTSQGALFDLPVKGHINSITNSGEMLCYLVDNVEVTCVDYSDYTQGVGLALLFSEIFDSPVLKLGEYSQNLCVQTYDATTLCKAMDSHGLTSDKFRIVDIGSGARAMTNNSENVCLVHFDHSIRCTDNFTVGWNVQELVFEDGGAKRVSHALISDYKMCIVDQTGDLYCTNDGFQHSDQDTHQMHHISANVTNIALGENYLCYVRESTTLNCLDSGGSLILTKPEATNTLLLSDSTVCHLSAADQIYNCTNLRTLEQHDYSVDSLVIPLFDSDNDGKKDIVDLFIVDPSVSKLCPPGSYGLHSCSLSDPGHFVPFEGMNEQYPCPPGTYQNVSGSTLCREVPENSFTSLSGSAIPTFCRMGEVIQFSGATLDLCEPVPPGYFMPEINMKSTPCPVTAYQPSPGQAACLDARPGHFVQSEGATGDEPCQPGTYQPSPGQAACLDARPGHFVQSEGAIGDEPCQPGTYQPSPGQSDCLDARPGHFVQSEGATGDEPCQPGTYQPSPGQSDCLNASPGYYVKIDASISQTIVDQGYYSSGSSMTGQERCPDGTTTLTEGSTSQADCSISDWGYINTIDGIVPCPTGTSTTEAGSTSPEDCSISASGYVMTPDGISPCQPGTYQPSPGQPDCLDARPGHFVQSEGATGDEPCQPGTYQPSRGSPTAWTRGRATSSSPRGPPGTGRASRGPTSPRRGSPTAWTRGRATSSSPRGPPGTSRASRGPTSPLRGSPTASTRGRATSSSPRGPPGTSRASRGPTLQGVAPCPKRIVSRAPAGTS